MRKHVMVLPDGSEISSGNTGASAYLRNVEVEQLTNNDDELTLGSVCSACMTATLISPGGALSIAAGTKITLYTDDDGNRERVGVFNLEKPTRRSANSYKLTAYDNVSKLDVDVASWLNSLKNWPYYLYDFAYLLCEYCGVSLGNTSLPNGKSYKIQQFTAESVTGRQLMSWVGEACVKYCIADAEGQIYFGWYTASDVSIKPAADSEAGAVAYYDGSLSYEDYEVAAIERVQIKQSDTDTGVVWPPSAGNECNTYVVSNNYLLLNDSTANLEPIAQTIYQALMAFTYTPCIVSVYRGSGINIGDIVTVTDSNGASFKTLVMSRIIGAGKETLESTGSAKRESSTAVNNQTLKALSGKVYSLQASVEGLKSTAEDLSGKYTVLEQNSGKVSFVAGTDQETMKAEITPDAVILAYLDANGNILSGFTFDTVEQMFKFVGGGSFTGSLNVNNRFVVTELGDVLCRGNTTIYGGKYFATDDDGNGGFTQMDIDGFAMYDYTGKQLVKIGFPSSYSQYPYIFLNAGDDDSGESGMLKRFTDGLWIGNAAPASAGGAFAAKSDYNGIFISFTDSKAYVVAGTTMQSLYTGEAIARFG